MGCTCSRSEGEETTRIRLGVGPDYQEIEGQTTGEGIKQTPAWQATITRAQLQAKRDEFWRSQTSGRRHVWMTIRQACEADNATAATLLQLAEITLEGNSLMVCYDRNKNRYEVPPFVINDPVKLSDAEPKRKGLKKKEMKEKEIKLKLRNMTTHAETEFQIHNTSQISDLKKMYLDSVKDNFSGTVRLFFGGKELKDEATLASYSIGESMVVQVFLKPAVS